MDPKTASDVYVPPTAPLDEPGIPEDGQGGNIPNWCNHNHAMGAWMNFRRLRVICKVGYGADLGPYGGIFDR